MADCVNQGGQVVLVLSDGEAAALRALASKGAADLMTNPAAAMTYIGGSTAQAAARRALGALGVSGYSPNV